MLETTGPGPVNCLVEERKSEVKEITLVYQNYWPWVDPIFGLYKLFINELRSPQILFSNELELIGGIRKDSIQ